MSLDPRLLDVREALRASGAPASDRADPTADRMEAAVSLVLRAGEDLDFLVIKRATSERDRWSGQMALPGGRWERTDSGLLHTARRETREETGVHLEAVGTFLGRLPDVRPATNRIPPLRIAPFVFGVPWGTRAVVASPEELESVHWVPVSLLDDPSIRSEVLIEGPGFRKVFPSFRVGEEHVWGLTYSILESFRALWSMSEGD